MKTKRNRVEINLQTFRDKEIKGSRIINKMIELNIDGEKVAKSRKLGYNNKQTKKVEDEMPEDPSRIIHVPFY